METIEKIIFKNDFGTVTDKRVVLNYKSGAEFIQINQITSVSFLQRRNYFFALGNFLIAFMLTIGLIVNIQHLNGIHILILLILDILFIISGFANWIGHHIISISVGGLNRDPLKVEMSKTKEGRKFIDAINKEIFK